MDRQGRRPILEIWPTSSYFDKLVLTEIENINYPLDELSLVLRIGLDTTSISPPAHKPSNILIHVTP